MALSVGIIGLPNVGKSSLLNALARCGAQASNYPFCTIEKNVGIAEVPDENLDLLAEILDPEEATPTSIKFIDVAGLVEGASRGEGLGNKFLGHIRETDALLHVVRCFENENVTHVYTTPDPVRDADVVETELLLADLKTGEKGLEQAERAFQRGHKNRAQEVDFFRRCVEALKAGTTLRTLVFNEEESCIARETNFLTEKPILYLANVDENDTHGSGTYCESLKQSRGTDQIIPVSVRIEEEITQLPVDEGKVFLDEMGLKEPGLNRVILSCYRFLDLITFYTIANNKLRAWQLTNGGTAPAAAGKVHTDMEKGFIRAEVMGLSDLLTHKSRSTLAEKGLVQTVGKDYEVEDHDILQFHFKA